MEPVTHSDSRAPRLLPSLGPAALGLVLVLATIAPGGVEHRTLSVALVRELALANSVTAWPRRTSSSVRYDTARSGSESPREGTGLPRGGI